MDMDNSYAGMVCVVVLSVSSMCLHGEQGEANTTCKGRVDIGPDAGHKGCVRAPAFISEKEPAELLGYGGTEGSGFKRLGVAAVSVKRLEMLNGYTLRTRVTGMYNAPYYVLTLTGELTNKIAGIRRGQVNRAVTDNGYDLKRTEEEMPVRYFFIEDDGRTLTFDVLLFLPPGDAKFLRELSGVLYSPIQTGEVHTNLEIELLKEGVESDVYAAKILQITPYVMDESSEWLTLRLGLDESMIKSVLFFDEEGKPIDATMAVMVAGESDTEVSLIKKGVFPEKGAVHVVTYETVEMKEYPFCIRNMSLLGVPMKTAD